MARVLVSEFVCGGAWSGAAPEPSLVREGRAMLRAVVEDLLSIEAVQVTTTWDRRLGPWGLEGGSGGRAAGRATGRLSVIEVGSPEAEAGVFAEQCRRADRVLVIAPEFSGILADRCRLVEQLAPGTWAGGRLDAIERCADKLALVDWLTARGLPTIPTEPFDPARPEPAWPFPLVIKPRDGAGSTLTFRVDDSAGLVRVSELLRREEGGGGFEFLQQSFVRGLACSTAALIPLDGTAPPVVLPPGEQRLSDDGRFRYLGADVPGRVSIAAARRIESLVRMVCQELPGLRGYAGFDLIVPEAAAGGDGEPVLVEINPRLTTGWLAWRKIVPNELRPLLAGMAVPAGRLQEPSFDGRTAAFRLTEV